VSAVAEVQKANGELAELAGQYMWDPLGFVKAMFPWDQAPLNAFGGPDVWQADVLAEIGAAVRARRFDGFQAVSPVRYAVASGHNIGKSALSAWLVLWIMSTRPYAQGTITANTSVQLETKTWAAVMTWHERCATGHWFECSGTGLRHREAPKQWFCTPQTCREERSEAFAGQQAATSTSFYIFDEASAVPDAIWDVAEGGLTGGEPMIFCFGNPTRSTGRFYEVVFGSKRENWPHRSIDSRLCRLANKETIADWERTYGEDSDFFRVRARGIPPRASELQYIEQDRVDGAQRREALSLEDDPLVCGVDVSGGGAAWTVCYFRRGKDGRSIPRIRLTGEQSRSRNVLVGRLAEVLRDSREGHRVAAMFIDSAFGGPLVERLRMLGFDNVHEVNFGEPAWDPHFANMRAFMWGRMKDWLANGAIPEDSELELQLTGPGYHINRSNKLVIESKQDMTKRGVASPDDADALALTFAQNVAPPEPERPRRPAYRGPDAWMT
jgi:hypothetical protein